MDVFVGDYPSLFLGGNRRICYVWVMLRVSEQQDFSPVLLSKLPNHKIWLAEELKKCGWDFLDHHWTCHPGWEWVEWGLVHGVAPDQPFLLRLELVFYLEYNDDYDANFPYEILDRAFVDSLEVARRWEAVMLLLNGEYA